jgi:HEAT repeat protein
LEWTSAGGGRNVGRVTGISRGERPTVYKLQQLLEMPLLDAKLLIADIASGDKQRCRIATEIISEIEENTDVDVEIFASSLSSEIDNVVFWCVIALEHLGERGSAAIPQLLNLLKRDQLFLRQSAVKTLAVVGPKNKDARAAVFHSFSDSSPFVRREALQACIKLPNLSKEQLTRISAMAADPDESVSSWSEIALRNIRLNGQANA